MISLPSFLAFVFIGFASLCSGFFWQDEYTAVNYGKLVRFFFGGKTRSLFTSQMILMVGIVVFVLGSPEIELSELLGVFVGAEGLLLGIGLGAFLNWRISKWSFAPVHRIATDKIIELHEKNKLHDDFLEAIIRSMVAETNNGNTSSHHLLKALLERTDDLGVRVERIIEELDSEIAQILKHKMAENEEPTQ
ncbi:MAG: hypothetical protein ACXADD_15180 [Candidatus Thorarchaeota archaeon]|jgi:hypothetical protein